MASRGSQELAASEYPGTRHLAGVEHALPGYVHPVGRSTGTDPHHSGFSQALDQVLAGETVANAQNKSYGCSVKYKQ